MNFTELGLSEKTIKAIEEAGMSTPTTVQSDVIPSVLAGKDVFTIAPSKCGKTCSYVLPLIDIISKHQAQNILIITAGSKYSVAVSDKFAVFNKYHEINETALTDNDEQIDQEANVIIASPKLLLDLLEESKIDLSKIDILVVDDINLIKTQHQLKNLEKILEVLPADKQNIVFTNRRSKETQSILDKILKTPEEIKINKAKEEEAVQAETTENYSMPDNSEKFDALQSIEKSSKKAKKENGIPSARDYEAVSLMKRYHTFGRKTPEFMLSKADLVADES